MSDWIEQGCGLCRAGILTGDSSTPERLETNIEAHAHLRRCQSCGSWWIENEREAHVIPLEEARSIFPAHFR